jgi:two-component system phosphate regulon sensor histidine kinase PhoR
MQCGAAFGAPPAARAAAGRPTRPERDLQDAEARYRALFEGAVDPILVADAEGRYLDANPAAAGLLGYTRDELLGLRVADVVAGGVDSVEAEYARFLQEGRWSGELEVRRRDGSTVAVEARATAVVLPTGPLYISILRDVSERRAAEQMQREFLAMVTHELRTPLTSVKGYAQLMQRRGVYSDQAVGVIVSRAAHLERLLGDLLDLSRLEGGRLELRRARVDLVVLARAMAEQAQVLTRLHAVRVEAPERPLEGWWDRDRVEQVLQNLLSNAVKYSPEGGEVVLRVEDVGGEARVAVTDRGLGVSAEALPRLFDRFYQARIGRTAGDAEGLGLGLYITRSLVEAHGGRIQAESVLGRGSTFAVTLPYGEPGES